MEEFSYNRKYELIVSKPIEDISVDPANPYRNTPLENESIVFKSTDNYQKINRLQNVIIDSLHFTADIETSSKTSGSKGNTATIKIFNLSNESRSIVENVNNYVVLNAGYESDGDSLPIVFSGQVQKAYSERQGSDFVTILVCKDGYTPSNSVRLSYRANRGKTYADVIRDFAEEWRKNGVAYTSDSLVLDEPTVIAPVVEATAQNTVLERGYIFSGFLRKAMDEVTEMFNLVWYIENNTLYVHPKFYKKMIGEVVVNSGSIISIQSSQDNSKTTSSNSEKKGVRLKLFLDGRIKSYKRIKIEDTDKAGTYRISSVSHRLQYEGSEWYTIVEAEGG
ncbi:MAG: hypothetical protein GOVbin4162_33 [Prokaryotic dsDNA virus sp.]|nr:MAG: hypothetical protein GOVbin4162_33 [Prokaryotic dsDNA virus sp.]|tara:strand:- start:248 stop:1255 length:1008 start_codon:yes stop_codon:yes gene_type:complete